MNKAKIAKANAAKAEAIRRKNLEIRKMPVGYAVLWGVMTFAYAIWMIVFMRNKITTEYHYPQWRYIDNISHKDITGIHTDFGFVFWLLLSVACFLLFIVYISKILYARELTDTIKKICLVSLIFGCVYIVWYGFFDFPNANGRPVDFNEKVTHVTASMIGLEFPWHFRGWGMFASASIFMNSMYAFRKYEYYTKVSKLCVVLSSIGSAAIFVTVNCPSWGEVKDFSVPRCLGHWLGAIVFAGACAIPIVIFLLSKAIKERGRYLIAAILFGLVLGALLGFTVAGFKSAIIENIPMVAAYVLLFVLNFTNIFPERSETSDAVEYSK